MLSQATVTKAEKLRKDRGLSWPDIADELDCNVDDKTGLPRHPIGKPDRDNLDKAVMDALVRSGLLADDAQITDGRIRKRWATDRPGGQPGATICIREDRE